VVDVALIAVPPEDLDGPHTVDVAASVGDVVELDAQAEQEHDAPATDRTEHADTVAGATTAQSAQPWTEERAAAAWLDAADRKGVSSTDSCRPGRSAPSPKKLPLT